MSSVIKFFRTLISSFTDLILWVVGLPAALYTAVSSVVSASRAFYDAVTSPQSSFSDIANALADKADAIQSSISEMPEIINIGLYCLSLDVLYHYAIIIISGIFSMYVLVLTFVFVGVPAVLIPICTIKFSCWLYTSLVPTSWVPNFVHILAHISIPLPYMDKALKQYLFGSK